MLRRLVDRPDLVLRLGLGAFALGGLARISFHPAGAFWRDVLDGVSGFGTGALIGAFFLSVLKGRSCPSS